MNAIPVDLTPFAICEIGIPQRLRDTYQTNYREPVITTLSRMNVFIGPNNSGKSLLLRSLFAERNLPLGLRDTGSNMLRAEVKALINHVSSQPDSQEKVQRLSELNAYLPPLYDKKYVDCGGKLNFRSFTYLPQIRARQLNNMNAETWNGEGRKPVLPEFTRVYIPTMRGLRPSKADPYFYSDRTKEDYFKKETHIKTWRELSELNTTPDDRRSLTESINIHTGQEMYEIIRSHLLGTLDMRRKIADFQAFVSHSFYNGAEFTLTPQDGSDVLVVKIGNEEERKIYELGDGIQHMLIMMLPLFIHKDKNLLLFIEEPELYLHPGFQRILINNILDNPEVSRQVFIATHSHQFLDITIDRSQCSVYRVSKKGSQQRVQFHLTLASDDEHAILAELGVKNSSVLLSNCTIWVEGITDRIYLRRFLKIWAKANGKAEFTEDLHYSFVEYGGGCITHWSFLDEDSGIDVERLCGRLFLIADKDKGKEKRHLRLQRKLADRVYILGCVEIENLLTPGTIRAVIHHYEQGAADCRHFTQDEYRDKKLGRFIDEQLTPTRSDGEAPRKYADESGTVKDKVAFCRHAVASLTDSSELSDEARTLCEKIYNFIESCN